MSSIEHIIREAKAALEAEANEDHGYTAVSLSQVDEAFAKIFEALDSAGSTQWAVRSRAGQVWTCSSEHNARGMLRTTSTIVPGKSGERDLIKRINHYGDWEVVK